MNNTNGMSQYQLWRQEKLETIKNAEQAKKIQPDLFTFSSKADTSKPEKHNHDECIGLVQMLIDGNANKQIRIRHLEETGDKSISHLVGIVNEQEAAINNGNLMLDKMIKANNALRRSIRAFKSWTTKYRKERTELLACDYDNYLRAQAAERELQHVQGASSVMLNAANSNVIDNNKMNIVLEQQKLDLKAK
jgi:hypothetical protein